MYITVWHKYGFKLLDEHLNICKYIYYYFLISFGFVNFWVVEWFLKNELNNFLTNIRVNRLKLCPHYLKIVNVNNIKKIII